MPRRAAALLVLLALAAVPPPTLAQDAPFGLPTQVTIQVGPLEVMAYVAHDPGSVAFSPGAAREAGTDPFGYLRHLYNLNFTAGSGGILYVKVTAREASPLLFRGRVSTASPLLGIVPAELNNSASNPNICPARGGDLECTLTSANETRDNFFQFQVAGGATAGATIPLLLHMEAWRNDTGTPSPVESKDHVYTLLVLEPAPPWAARVDAGPAVLYAWIHGESLGAAASSCLAGAAVARQDLIRAGSQAVLCLRAVPKGEEQLRVRANATGPAWLTLTPAEWESKPFNASSSGLSAPATGLVVHALPDAPPGPAEARVAYVVERFANGTWAEAARVDLGAPFTVSAVPIELPRDPQVQWLAQAPVLLLTVAGLGFVASRHRRPRLRPRSQALRDLRRKGREEPPSAGAAADQQRKEAHEASWEKKRRILEAKREDVLKSIRVAEERKERGEITDHVLQGLKGRKERQLEQIEKEMEELR